MTMDLPTLAGFIIAFLFLGYASGWINRGLDWLFMKLFGLFKRWFIKTEHEMISYLHWQHRAAKNGHEPKMPVDCTTNDCIKIEH